MIRMGTGDGQSAELLGSDPSEAVESLLVAEFRAALLMEEDEELPLDQSFFGLGLTSLRLMEVKQRVEAALGCEVSANVLFNFPTVERLVEHLVNEVLPNSSAYRP